MLRDHSLFVELETTLTHGSHSQRFTILRRMTDLFLAGKDTYSDDHIAIFDTLIVRLIEKIEHQALIELSGKFAPVDRAPINVIGRLSRHDDIAVSGPILEQSNVLTDTDLVEIAKTKSQAHLSAIAGRKRIGEPVTDVLIDRGDSEVARKVTSNIGARFSRFGMATAVRRAEQDETLAAAVADRVDLPPDLLDTLVSKATVAVRERLLSEARPEMRQRITEVLARVSGQVSSQVAREAAKARSAPVDREQLKGYMAVCVDTRNVGQLIDAFSTYCDVPYKTVDDLVQEQSDEGMLVLGKASNMTWPELEGVLRVLLPTKTKDVAGMQALFASYIKLTAANAHRAIRFIRASAARAPTDTQKYA
ncbi:MAG: DUF2336 domain-containing protein [Pseudomonadota bacterium]